MSNVQLLFLAILWCVTILLVGCSFVFRNHVPRLLPAVMLSFAVFGTPLIGGVLGGALAFAGIWVGVLKIFPYGDLSVFQIIGSKWDHLILIILSALPVAVLSAFVAGLLLLRDFNEQSKDTESK